MLVPVVEVPSSAPPVALKCRSVFPCRHQQRKPYFFLRTDSSCELLLQCRTAGQKTESFKSSSEILIAVPSLYAESDACPNVSSEREYCCSSSIHTASPLEVTIGILRSPVGSFDNRCHLAENALFLQPPPPIFVREVAVCRLIIFR